MAVDAIPGDFVTDAELTVDDAKGRPSFETLQTRAKTTLPTNVRQAALRHPARLYLFDILAAGNGGATLDYRGVPLAERKHLLRAAFDDTKTLIYITGIPDIGEWVFEQAIAHDLEGMIAKRLDAPYLRGRSRNWLKVKHAGYSRPAALGFGRA
ncbi:DNA ligase [Paraburkholderia sp. MM5477-R1]|uniref:ATP-dependent DNA ligase n=1 Tax=Paraburkholderia sp. MM5477-R1 TaxID=2991062 RepID=UPI003D1F49C5